MAVTYEQALDIARGHVMDVDYVTEYEDAWSFSVKDDMSFGGQGPVVVLKGDGRAINFVGYLDMSDGKALREGYIASFDAQ